NYSISKPRHHHALLIDCPRAAAAESLRETWKTSTLEKNTKSPCVLAPASLACPAVAGNGSFSSLHLTDCTPPTYQPY
ncbi:unnamed protein product, partial [Closterium sp. Naga37s-1]